MVDHSHWRKVKEELYIQCQGSSLDRDNDHNPHLHVTEIPHLAHLMTTDRVLFTEG